MAMIAMILLVLAPTVFAGRAAEASESPSLDAIRARGVLRVGATGDYTPFSLKTPEGGLTGADVDMAHALAGEIGVGVEFVPTTWGTLLPDFVAGHFDVAMGGVTITPDRAAKGDFSLPLMVDGKRPIVRCADKDRLVSIAAIDRPDIRVIVNPGASNEVFAKTTFKTATVTVYPDNITIFDQIAAGKADVMVTDGIEVDHQSARHAGVLCPAVVAAPFTHFEKAYLLPKDSAMKQFVDAWLTRQMASGSWQAALDRALR
ncbi:MAG TPA: transporter substrate-binding domain-containing protein [Stellaceae bacterium]|nr:transporter substrate-binding domain-containing protein [Stellaceae bacterium]